MNRHHRHGFSTRSSTGYCLPTGRPGSSSFGSRARRSRAPSPFVDEKRAAYPSGLTPPISSHPSTSMFGFFQPIVAPITNALDRIQDIRTRLELSNPGTVEHLQREVKGVHTTNFMFDGARADLTKAISINPIFQVTHAFSMGSQAAPSSYNFGAVYGDNKNFFQAGLDDGLNVTMRANRGWVPGHTTKVQAQLTATPGQSFVQMEHDYQGTDHSANFKALNPSPTDLTGIYIVNYLQSLTRNFAFGIETVYQRPSADMEEASTGYIAKLTGDKKDWIATAQVQPQGVAQCTYYHKLSEQVDVAADLQMITMPQKREAAATVGARYNFRMATLRAQIDSAGKLSSVYETRLSPAFGLTFAGEIDHLQERPSLDLELVLRVATRWIRMLPLPRRLACPCKGRRRSNRCHPSLRKKTSRSSHTYQFFRAESKETLFSLVPAPPRWCPVAILVLPECVQMTGMKDSMLR